MREVEPNERIQDEHSDYRPLGFIGSHYGIDYQKTRSLGLDIKSGDDILTATTHPKVVEMVIHLAGIGGVRESSADPRSIE